MHRRVRELAELEGIVVRVEEMRQSDDASVREEVPDRNNSTTPVLEHYTRNRDPALSGDGGMFSFVMGLGWYPRGYGHRRGGY